MVFQLFKAERNKKNQAMIRDALKTLHDVEQDYTLSPDYPFTVENNHGVTTISIDDCSPYFKVLADSFSCILTKRIADREAAQKPKRKPKKVSTPLDDKLAAIFSILDKKDNEVFATEHTDSISISIKGKHEYNIYQMRKLCTMLKKFNPTFTCKDSHFIIKINI